MRTSGKQDLSSSTPTPSLLSQSSLCLRTALPSTFHEIDTDALKEAKRFWTTCRNDDFSSPTSGVCPGLVQANMVLLPKEHAFDFTLFALKNPRAVPLLGVTDVGERFCASVAPSMDLFTDVPRYVVWRDGVRDETTVLNASNYHTEDMVGFLLGCSFSCEDRLSKANLTPRNVSQKRNVSMYDTDVVNNKAGVFGGTLVVSMRPYPLDKIEEVSQRERNKERWCFSHASILSVHDP